MPNCLVPNIHPVRDDVQLPGQGKAWRPEAQSSRQLTSQLGVAGLAAVKSSVHNTWLLQLSMLRAQGLLLLLGVLVLPEQQVDGAALDLAALVRQYEDQVGAQLRFLGPQRLAYAWHILNVIFIVEREKFKVICAENFGAGAWKASCPWRG